ncbi:hypothetical protein TWF679_010511 [Orbilia oligospora]|uniref:G protein-coupled receptor GPR1/2/3 C-terminal domain-containing protein n=1 Tax=Orbilia oligospora TaxID=2813651 RepID=A0A8H8V0G0_ORBOL|nr:hypothetical protein TWF679_010511 [Orbilia oligospora]
MALNFMFSAGWNVAGGDLALEESRTACSVNGFLTQVFVVQRPWVLSIIIAAICHGVLGYGYIGGWCWLTSDLMRLLINFIPRWLIVIAIALIYIRLYMIVRKARKWDIEGVSPDPGDDMADTSVILVAREEGSRARTVNVNSSRSLSLGMRQPLNAAQLKRIAKKMMVYPVAYAIIWACPTAIRIYQGTTGSRAPLWITIVDKSCIVIQGLVDAVVYGE